MTTSRSPSVLSEINDEKPIPVKTLRYFRRVLQNRFHDMILQAFIEQEQKGGLTQKKLADRLGRDTATVNRWLNTASNYELDSISDLLLGLKVDLDDPSYTSLEGLERQSHKPDVAALHNEPGILGKAVEDAFEEQVIGAANTPSWKDLFSSAEMLQPNPGGQHHSYSQL